MSESLATWSTCSGSDSTSYMKPRNSCRTSASFILGHERAKAQTAGAHENLAKSELIHDCFVNRDSHRHNVRAICRNACDVATLCEGERPKFLHPVNDPRAAHDRALDFVA